MKAVCSLQCEKSITLLLSVTMNPRHYAVETSTLTQFIQLSATMILA